VLADLLNVLAGLMVWTLVWTGAVTLYLNRWEPRRGFPSRRHRFALLSSLVHSSGWR
jgi:hypothetical protein